ncbi:MAG: class I SAM-dependent methyltransferase [Gemmatimonadales bacterium]
MELPSRKIVVNVTWSCPTFAVPTPGVPDVAAAFRQEGLRRILDFGAGKLRNTLFLLSLRRGFRVWAVEFEDCFQTKVGKARLAEARRHKGFFLKKWPYEFLHSRFEVDAVLLVNVANVVPHESERKRIVAECTRRLRKGGRLLWMSQYGEPYYKPGVTRRLQSSDGGWFYNLGKEFQTYYREFSIAEIRSHFDSRRYREIGKVSAPHHHAFLFEKL